MKRTQQILIAVLAVQVILVAVVFWPRAQVAGSGNPLLEGVTADAIVQLTITDETQQSITLRQEGGAWVDAGHGNYPARAASITPLLEKLVKVNTRSLATDNASSHKRLQVAENDFVRRLDVGTADGKQFTLYLGSAPRYSATHVRLQGQDATYMTTDLSTWELNVAASTWVTPAYVTIDAATLVEVAVKNAHGAFTLVKDGENWTLKDLKANERIAAGKSNGLVRNATSVTLLEPLGAEALPEYGMESPLAEVTLKDASGKTYTLTVGAKGEADSAYAVKSSESPYYVRVAEFNVQSLVETARAALLDTGTPTPSAAE